MANMSWRPGPTAAAVDALYELYGKPNPALAPLATALIEEVKRSDGAFKHLHLEKWALPLCDELKRLGVLGISDPHYIEYQGAWEFGVVHVHVTGDTDPSAECWIVVTRDGIVSVQ